MKTRASTPCVQIVIRAENPRLIAALDSYARDQDRARSNAALVLIRQALEREGYWPQAVEAAAVAVLPGE